jgi:3-hydroxybutyryl-CoA dehydratase
MQLVLTKTITKEMIQAFAELTEDFNPIHLDETYAASTRFQKCISHGFLVASMFSPLFAKEIPGCIYVSQVLRFLHPVYPGDTIEIRATLSGRDKKRLDFSTNIFVDKKEVISGEAQIYDAEGRMS